jgi:molecular chaperone GrpE
VAAHRGQREDERATGNVTPIDAPGSESDLPAVVAGEATLAEQAQKLAAEKQDLTNTLVRLQADFDNYRKRIEKERGQERHRGVETVVEYLLPVLDGFDRALAAHEDPAYEDYRKGFELIRKQLWDVLAKQGVQRVDALGKAFDPHAHHAIEQVASSEYDEGTVVEELQPGYTFHGRVLRPAMVRISGGRKN